MADIKQRQSNIELLRLVAMFLIVFTHTNFFSLGRPKIAAYNEEPFWITMRFGLQSFTYIGVNLFILISGYFSIKPKFRAVCAFLFQILFFSLAILGIIFLVGLVIDHPLVKWKYLGDAFLILTRFNWFIPSYLILMLFAPMINSFCQNSTRFELGTFIILLFAASSYLGWSERYCKEFNDGYSFVSLILLYVIGRFLRLHQCWLTNRSWKVDASHFVIYVVVNTAIALWRMNNPYKMSLFALNNPIQLYGAVCFFLFFTKIKLQSNVINTLAKGTFGIFLLQMHPQVIPHFRKLIQYLNSNMQHGLFVATLFVVVLIFCVLGIVADKPRQWLWNKVDVPLMNFYERIKAKASSYPLFR
ncbi:MAG: acyltransferase family protein [Alistipes sp.]|nr:acyltransferase family protein [Candidatus Alistipes equi]